MGRPIKTQKLAVQAGYGNQSGYGVVGGNTALAGTQIVCQVKIGSNAEATGYIIRQKGARRFLVSDGTNTGTCVLADLADGALTNDTMTITITDAAAATARLAKLGDEFGVTFAGVGYYLTFGAASATKPAPGLYEVATVNNA
jgi:predicted nucleic acid-binding Zn ribbon protein